MLTTITVADINSTYKFGISRSKIPSLKPTKTKKKFMNKRNEKDNEDESLSTSDSQDQVIINMPPVVDLAHVVYLPDANLGATETEDSGNHNQELGSNQGDEMVDRRDNDPSTSAQSKERRKLEELKSLSIRNVEVPNRMHNVLELLHRFARNLDVIEARLTEDARPAVILQVPQYYELGTQTAEVLPAPRRYRLDLTNLRTDPNCAPCERSHHTITISGNNMPPNRPQLRQTFCARIGRSICDFAGAFCLCLQVNKDCVFCLGFFVAFVISASFLTAFFYRTLSFTASPAVRVAASPVTGTAHYELVTLRFNGGYYYIYNSNQQKFP
ncbi:uncharacterized protein LOC108149354 [Drosophila elegans]|uniref:uncharacterized protein LOC108149354 n=1 Tax=Drosophila elegans TaxID=30023 RepID=UPI0007E63155|nr:uncharacterized protein LOC108149354 [Drosophila elegans]